MINAINRPVECGSPAEAGSFKEVAQNGVRSDAFLSTESDGARHTLCASNDHFVELVENIKDNKECALEELYGLVKNFTFFLMRQLGTEDLQDSLHDIYLAVVQAIQAGRLRNPERLTAFLTAVARFHTYTKIDMRVRSRTRHVVLDGMDVPDSTNLEQRVYGQQKLRLVRDMLRALSPLDREVLRRFYLEDHSKERICRELQLTANQFRNIKSQAKLTLTDMGHRHLHRSAKTAAGTTQRSAEAAAPRSILREFPRSAKAAGECAEDGFAENGVGRRFAVAV